MISLAYSLSLSLNVQQKLASLEAATAKRRNKLNSSSEYLQFNWKADLVDSWISKSWYLLECTRIVIFIYCHGYREQRE